MSEEVMLINDIPHYKIPNGTSYRYAPIPKEFKPYFERLQQENKQLKEMHETMTKYALENEVKIDKLKEVIDEVREYIKSNPNVFYDEYLIDVETLKMHEHVDEIVGEIKFISNLLQILDKVKGE